jgi:hypothetical protein
MLRDFVVFAALFLVLSTSVLFALGERFRANHWLWSQLAIATMAAATCGVSTLSASAIFRSGHAHRGARRRHTHHCLLR